MSLSFAFAPGPTVSVSCSTTSASGTIGIGSTSMRLANIGSAPIFVRWGTGTQTAVTTDFPVLPNTAILVSKPADVVTVAAITASGTGTLYITTGEGGL